MAETVIACVCFRFSPGADEAAVSTAFLALLEPGSADVRHFRVVQRVAAGSGSNGAMRSGRA